VYKEKIILLSIKINNPMIIKRRKNEN